MERRNPETDTAGKRRDREHPTTSEAEYSADSPGESSTEHDYMAELDVPRGDAKSAHIVPAKSHSERLAQAGVLVPVVTQVVVVANVNRVAVWALFCRLRAAEKTVSTHFCHKKIVKICLFWIALNAV